MDVALYERTTRQLRDSGDAEYRRDSRVIAVEFDAIVTKLLWLYGVLGALCWAALVSGSYAAGSMVGRIWRRLRQRA